MAIQKARADQAAAEVQQAQAQLDQAKLNLSYTKIIAPAAGIVTRKSVGSTERQRRSEHDDPGLAR